MSFSTRYTHALRENSGAFGWEKSCCVLLKKCYSFISHKMATFLICAALRWVWSINSLPNQISKPIYESLCWHSRMGMYGDTQLSASITYCVSRVLLVLWFCIQFVYLNCIPVIWIITWIKFKYYSSLFRLFFYYIQVCAWKYIVQVYLRAPLKREANSNPGNPGANDSIWTTNKGNNWKQNESVGKHTL